MTPAVSIVDAMRDPALFAQRFPLPAWQPWVSCAAALSGLTGGDLSPTALDPRLRARSAI